MFVAIRRLLLFATGLSVPISQAQAFTIGPTGVTVNRLVTAALLAVVVVEVVTSRRSMPRNPKNAWIAALGLGMFMGLIVGFVKVGDLTALILYGPTIVSYVLFYYLLLYVLGTRRDLDVLLAGLIVGVLLTAGSVLAGYRVEGEELADRTGGFRGDPNGYSYVAVATIPIVAAYYFLATSRFRKVILLGVAFVMLQAIIASLSRGGFLAVTGAFALWMFRFRRFDTLRFAVPVAIILGIFGALTSPEWRERMMTMATPESRAAAPSIQARLVQYPASLHAFASNPLVGVGWAQYSEFAAERKFAPGARVIHNCYLQVIAEMGLMGFVPFVAILVLTWRDLSRAWLIARRRNIRGDPELHRLYLYAVFLQIGFFGTLIANTFLQAFRFKESWILYACSTVLLSFVRARVAELEAGDGAVATPQPGSAALSGPFSAGGTQPFGS